MNLKRIIQEEINDFDWVREIPLIPKEPTVGFEFTLEGDDHSVVYRIDSVDYSTFTVSWGSEMQSDRHVSDEYHVNYYQWYEDDKIIPVDTDMFHIRERII